MSGRIKRTIVREVITWDERATMAHKTFSWRRTSVHTLTAECGHVVVKRGMLPTVPKYIFCKACEAGKFAIPIDPTMHWRFDKTNDSALSKMAVGIIETAAKKTS